ncbi:ABC transporter permease [Lachnospiraceae bacterium AM40-2BH]|nr:ABC transporter permease [Lachnospiraceae bacterium AM40-2BH]
MKMTFYPKMAWMGIRKNSRMYIPYLLTCAGMIAMYYIMAFLAFSNVLLKVEGGEILNAIMGLGSIVIGVFALIFLFYTNSFLIRRRKKEFGLYNILGMGKANLAHVLIWENVMSFLISLGGGLTVGILLSKFSELCLLKLVHMETGFSMQIDWEAVGKTVTLFAVIFLLLLLNALRQVRLANPIELLHSEQVGEKPPRANWILAIAGAVILAGAYYIAVSIEDPITAMVWFFVAVVMVIIATYLLFIAGSVTLCRILQRKKKYYYKTQHFISVSSMMYRMKRNGAGLASICILGTMVLVMLSSTICMYVGAEDALRRQYPRNIDVTVETYDSDGLWSGICEDLAKQAEDAAKASGQEPENIMNYKTAAIAGAVIGDQISLSKTEMEQYNIDSYSDLWEFYVVSLDEYNRVMGTEETLKEDEAIICTTKAPYKEDTIAIQGGKTYKIKKEVKEFAPVPSDAMTIFSSMFLIVPDFDAWVQETEALLAAIPQGEISIMLDSKIEYVWVYGYDLACADETQNQIINRLNESVLAYKAEHPGTDGEVFTVYSGGVATARESFYTLYGGIFFLGIMLGIVFVFAAVLIVYYKQISEGYEDQSRFEIMQKVGMTKREIRKSINSQMLTVFFLPLVTAGIHLAFAFPLIYKLIQLFGIDNLQLLICAAGICFVIFGLFYVLVYRLTSEAYYSIVSGARER